MVEIKQVFKMNGFMGLFFSLGVIVIGCFAALLGLGMGGAMSGLAIVIGGVVAFLGLVFLAALTTIQPNESVVVTFFGKYLGVIKETGYWWTVPFSSKKKISLRVRNFESGKLKVNDADGNPIEVGAIIVYRVIDPMKATFDVEDYEQFVKIQSETGLRHVVSMHPYDTHREGNYLSLRANADEVAKELQEDLQARLDVAGVEIVEARLMHLAYAPEIAPAMLQRQQATAILASRQVIVEGAVGMVKLAIEQLEKDGTVKLSEDRKAAMINNLMVSIVSERSAQPVVNTGSSSSGH